MKLIIDEKACLKHKLTLEEFLMAYTIRQIKDKKKVHENLLNREVITLRNGKNYVTQHWSEVIDEIIADSSITQDESRLKNLAAELRKVYPEGRMIDRRTGQLTTYYFRSNPSEVTRKLKTFFLRYGEYSDEDIIDATKRYVASWRGNYQQRGFRQLKYFILKDETREGPDSNYVESISPLLDFLTNKEDTENNSQIDNDWTSKMI